MIWKQGPEDTLKFNSGDQESLTPHHCKVTKRWGASRIRKGGTGHCKEERDVNLLAPEDFSRCYCVPAQGKNNQATAV